MFFFYIYGIIGICCFMLWYKGIVVVMDCFDLCIFLGVLVMYCVMFVLVVLFVMLVMVKSFVVDDFDLFGFVFSFIMMVVVFFVLDFFVVFEKKFLGV